jgi:hypothetical protein
MKSNFGKVTYQKLKDQAREVIQNWLSDWLNRRMISASSQGVP